MKKLHRNRATKLLKFVVLASSLSALAGLAQAADDGDKPFAMTVYQDSPYGSSILKGKFDRAIRKLSANPKTTSTPKNATNLCVAYAKSRKLEKAIAACDVAVAELSSKKTAMAKHPHRHGELWAAVQSDLSIALSNQGVLFAVKGEHDRARKSFLNAIELEYDRSQAQQNLERLDFVES